MAGDDSPFNDLDGSRDYGRVLVAVVCLLAVVLAASVVPAFSPQGTATPIESIVALFQEMLGVGGGMAFGGAGGSLGALSPGSQMSIGGDLGGENALQSQSAEVHFTVHSTQPAYWRTGAYDTYTGEGWRDDGESTPYDGSIPVEGVSGRTIHYEVELERTARALPTAWRPTEVSRENASVTSERAVEAERPLSAGTAYAGVSDRPPQDPALLRSAGRAYPAAVEQRYTQLPSETDDRLSPFTAQITDNASNPYETATRVQSWLEANKEYNLSVEQEPSDDVASQFVFEMDEGYCEYFATSMVAMLRSQDVPARYVVGYSTGRPTGQNTYEVRGMNAHAWVEVYFPEVGWVTFDPTPASGRLQQERDSLEAAGEATPTPSPTPTPTPQSGESQTSPSDGQTTERAAENATVTPSTDAERDAGTPTGTESAQRPPVTESAEDSEDATYEERNRQAGEYDVTLNRSAVPGAAVIVTVEQGSRPATGVTVLFNGDPVGTTNASGQVTAEIPYADRLEVTVEDGDAVPSVGAPPSGGPALFAVQGPQANSSTTFDLGTNATISVTGDAVTGNDVVVTATVDDVPVREAAVTVDGEAVATTDTRGRAALTLPTTPGNVTIAVERDSVSGETTLALSTLNVTVGPTAPLALPHTGARVSVTMDGEPVPDANVSRDGEPITSTGVDGTATVPLPLAENVTVAAAAHGQRGTATVDGLYTNLGIAGALLALLLGGVVAGAHRAGVAPRDVPGWFRRAGHLLVSAVVALGAGADRLLAHFLARVRLTAAHLRALVEGRRSLSELLAALREWFETRREAVRTPVEAGIEAGGSLVGSAEDGEAGAQTTVREGWERLLARVSLRRPSVHTPGEIAAHAVEADGLPADPVQTVVDAFRAVEYGKRNPDDRAPEVERAVEAIERALGADADAADSEVAD